MRARPRGALRAALLCSCLPRAAAIPWFGGAALLCSIPLAASIPWFGGVAPPSPPSIVHTAPGHCPLPHSSDPLPSECTKECTRDDDCEDDEMCCPYGCNTLCRKGTLPPHLHPISVIFCLILICGWVIACGNLSSGGGGGG